MNAAIIPSSVPYSLSPLADSKTIGNLSVFGVPLSVLTLGYLNKYNYALINQPNRIKLFKPSLDVIKTKTDYRHKKDQYHFYNYLDDISYENPLLLYEENLICNFDLSLIDFCTNKNFFNFIKKDIKSDITVILKPPTDDKSGLRVIPCSNIPVPNKSTLKETILNETILNETILNETALSKDDLNNTRKSIDFIKKIESIAHRPFGNTPFSYSLGGIFLLHPTTKEGISFINSAKDQIISKKLSGANLISGALSANLNICGILPKNCTFISVNTQKDYIDMHSEISKNKLSDFLGFSRLTSNAQEIKKNFWIEKGADIKGKINIEPPVFISSGCVIYPDSVLGPNVYLGKNCIVRSNTKISDSVIEKGVSISNYTTIHGAIIDKDVSIGVNSKISEFSVIGKGCRIGDNCIISPNVKISKNKKIENETSLNCSLLHSSLAAKHLFKYGIIDGEFNIDITAEFMSKLGCAIGTMFPDSALGISCDNNPMCEMLTQSLSSGIISTGSKLYDFKAQSLPIFRQGIRTHKLKAGVYVSHSDDSKIFCPEIILTDCDGANFNSRKERILEGIFFDNTFFRCSPEKIQDTICLKEFRKVYEQEILSLIKSSRFKINTEIRTPSETISEVLEHILGYIEKKAMPNAKIAFSADINRCGQKVNLYTPDLNPVSKYNQLVIIIAILIEHFDCKKVVLPISAPKSLFDKLTKRGVKIITCGACEDSFLRTILKNNLMLQFGLCFDGVFLSVILLDFLNTNNISLNYFINRIPSYSFLNTEVECPDTKKSEVIRLLYEKYESSPDFTTDLTHGIKIYQKEGWVLIFPEEYRHCIKVITEGYNTESAKDLSTKFINQIKRLAKPR